MGAGGDLATAGRGMRRGAALVAALGVAGGAAAGALAAFTADVTADATFAAAPDWTPPTATVHTVQKAEGGVPGFVRPGGGYRVLASFADTGNPASGFAAASADTTSLTAAASASALTTAGGPTTAGGVDYTHRSGLLTADGGTPAGARTYAITATDADANTGTQSGLTVTVDGTAPTAQDIQTVNAGAIAGRPEAGDRIVFTFSEPVDPQSIVAGWTGDAPTPAVVRFTNGFLIAADTVGVRNAANSAALPLTPADITLPNGGYVNGDLTFGASGTASTVTVSGATVTVTLGTASGTAATGGAGTLSWTPGAALYDRAGNAATTGAATESGASDAEF